MRALAVLCRFAGNTFALWILLFAVPAFCQPTLFLPLTNWIVPLPGLIMFGVGLTLKAESLREVARHPMQVLIGVLAQFIIMPGLALSYLAGKLFDVPLAGVPSALFSVWHNLSGPLLAAGFRRMDKPVNDSKG